MHADRHNAWCMERWWRYSKRAGSLCFKNVEQHMLKSITPIWSRLRHIHRPEIFLVHMHSSIEGEQPTVGQRFAERVAASVGSWWFLGGQAFFLLLWLVYNTLIFTRHFDSFPYI